MDKNVEHVLVPESTILFAVLMESILVTTNVLQNAKWTVVHVSKITWSHLVRCTFTTIFSEIYPYQRMYPCEQQEEFANFVYRGFQKWINLRIKLSNEHLFFQNLTVTFQLADFFNWSLFHPHLFLLYHLRILPVHQHKDIHIYTNQSHLRSTNYKYPNFPKNLCTWYCC